MNEVIEYKVIRSHRKTLALQVRFGQVLVRAPYVVDDTFINALIRKKSAWLKAKVVEQSQSESLCCNFSQNSRLFLFGRLTTLHISFAKKSSILLTEDFNQQQILSIALAERNKKKLSNSEQISSVVKKHIEQYFKQQAEDIIPQKVALYSQLTSLIPASIKIRQYRSRWGSCNNRGELSFNYLLMMLPNYVIDYVIVHELCHLQHLNHSKAFWQLVAKHFPNYRQAKQWVKSNQSALLWQLPSQ